MAVGSGLSATLGIATETTVGTPVAVTRFVEFNSESMQLKKTTVQGQGVRGGGLVPRAQRRNVVARQAAGDIGFDIPTSGFGLWLQHMLGSFATTPTSLGGGIFQQIHTPASLQGKAFTMQIVNPDTTGVLAQGAFTYPGCKIPSWEVSVQQGGQLGVKLTIDALDEATPGNTIANTTLSSLSAVSAVSISTVASIPIGSYITIDRGTLISETVQTTNVSGAGPFVITVPPLTYAHALGATVGSATAVNYGAAASLQAASYTAANTMWSFNQGVLVAGGATSVVSGVWTVTNGTTVANVRSFSLKSTIPLKTDRAGMGTLIRSEQLENGFRSYTAAAAVEYNSRLFYDLYAADVPMALKLTFTAQNGAILQFFVPVGYLEDGPSPDVTGPDIIIQNLNWTFLDDGVNGYLQAVITNTDAAV